jgi:hypothetical protein
MRKAARKGRDPGTEARCRDVGERFSDEETPFATLTYSTSTMPTRSAPSGDRAASPEMGAGIGYVHGQRLQKWGQA